MENGNGDRTKEDQGTGRNGTVNYETEKQESEDRTVFVLATKKVALLYLPSSMPSAPCPLLKIPGRVPFGSLGVVELIIYGEFVGS